MKVWERVVEARLRKVVEICEQQYGFMPRKSTTDAIFALRILMEKYRDGQRELHCLFVDLEKAYDRVPREELWYCMRKSGVAEKYVRVVQDMYERSRTVVRCAVGQTEEFNVEVGLHQGLALSPFLFAMVMDQLSEEVRQESPWTMMFADDIVICSESREQVEENLERWRFALERRGMKVSRSKTEYMCVNEREGSGTVRLQGEEVKKVQEFKYLGLTVQSNGECGKEVKKRVQAGWNGWRKVLAVLCDRKISARIKGKVYRTVVRAAMLYGLETVSLRKRQESELEVAELKMLRFSLGVTRLDRIRNEYIRGTAHVGRLGDKVREARLRWFGHVQRRNTQYFDTCITFTACKPCGDFFKPLAWALEPNSLREIGGGGGELLVSTGDIVGRWKEYFKDLLNPTDMPSVEEPEAEDSEVDSFLTQAEVTEVVQQLLGGKAPVVNEIRPEYLKSLDIVGLSWLTRLCNIVWRSGTVPLDWATRVVVPLFKKGDRRVCSNYRGITLLNIPGKVYSRVLERRVRPLVEPRIQEEQCGFRPSRGTLDQLYTLHRVLEGSWEFAQPVHMCFVDLEKAFDCVPRGILWEVLWEYGVRGPLLRAVRSLYNRSRSLVRIASYDVVLLASSSLDLQHALGHFAAECEAAGMRVSSSKSEAMVLNRKKVACTLQVGGEVLPQVEEFKYLEVLFTSEGRMDREIDRLIGAAAAVMRSMYRSVVVKKELSRKAKLLIYQSIYFPTLTYGHELWAMTERLRWLGHLFRMPPGRLPGEVFRACPTGKRPRGRPRTCWRDYVSRLAWERLRVPPEDLEDVSGERENSRHLSPPIPTCLHSLLYLFPTLSITLDC
ncbi:hypothetical protein QTP70_009001 [Hemibagrus guttatus]|uniref:ribonuclease H n=1 Tax=Hemibagrus guttatus TaxID=175788 RepID=A0AAE0Q0J0_9TELE|nr:hypothetical protein QTP70_009001 [Hemibagrus guttatus]